MIARAFTLRLLGVVLATGLGLGVPGHVAYADSLVVTAQGVDLKPGASIADNQRLSLPPGSSLQLIVKSGATVTLQGPYSGTVADYAKSRGVTTGLENSPTRGIGASRGGTR